MRILFRILALAAMTVMAASGPATADTAATAVEGRWQAVEYDPLIADNELFGQFRYDLLISRRNGALRIAVPRTGATYDRVRQDGERLVADGMDPTRGMSRLDIRFAGATFKGKVSFSSQVKRIEGRIDPDELASRERQAADTALRQARTAAGELREARQANALLQQQLEVAQATLERSEQKIALLQQQLNEAAARPRPPAPATLSAGGRARPPAQNTAPAIELIEPPLQGRARAEVADHGQDTVMVVGRVRGAGTLLALQANGRQVPLLQNGLFQIQLGRAEMPALLDIVAIDVNGTRATRSVTVALRGAAAPRNTTGTGMRKAAASATATCYQLAIVADPPDPSGPEVCRAAVESEPENALNHYHLATALSRLGRHAEAVSAYREAAVLWSRQ